MYAVFKTGGKQYRAEPGDVIRVEKLDAGEGDTVELDQLLMVADGDDVQIGTPMLEGGLVTGKVVSHGRGKKVKIVKFKRRKHHRKQMGHRQSYTEIEITGIDLGSGKKASKQPEKKAEQKSEKPAEKKEDKVEKAAGGQDDLKVISGIGPAIEKKLNGSGITTYQQIADLTDDEVDELEEKLAFKGRVERENWIEQARTLAAGGTLED